VSTERIIPDLTCQSLPLAARFYHEVLGLEPVMDHGWIMTLADPRQPRCQISLMTQDETAPGNPVVFIQVDDVDAAYSATVKAGAEVVHPLTDEPWGVRRFFVHDPDGHVLNILSHR
jgi:predicted enzyme related to lactoylglutathione lyase